MMPEAHIASSPSGTPGGDGAQPRPLPKRRKRAVISCVECHRRKQKCDRELPCSNCKFRNKESSCRYETAGPSPRSLAHDSTRPLRFDPLPKLEPPAAGLPPEQQPVFGPRASTGSPLAAASRKLHGTRLESAVYHSAAVQHAGRLPATASADADARLRERYKDLARQLPTRAYIDQLVDVYFREVNWQYYTVEQSDFHRKLHEWRRVPLRVFSATGPSALPADLRAFPALLFQVLANALLSVPDAPDGPFEPLKYTAAMALQDLAQDYSDSGDAVLALLGRGDVTVTTLQAGILRAMVFKTSVNIVGAWHVLQSTISDAQEMGLHDDALDPKPAASDFATIFENEWVIQRRRIIFMTLVLWDIHYSAVLGRPAFIDRRLGTPSAPIDAPIPRDKSTTPVRRRDEDNDAPTPLTRAIWLYKASALLWDVRELHQQPEDAARIGGTHGRVRDFARTLPSFLRLDGPDWRWDSHPGCSWLVSSRFYLAQLFQLALMALHRPYVFSSASSRTEALRAAVDMLAYQKMTFQGAELNSRKNVALFFGSLDAMILIAYIYIFFPRENRDILQDAAQQFEWTTVRFDAMRYMSPLARAAKGVAEAMYGKMRRAVEGSPPPPPPPPPTTTDPLSIASMCITPAPETPTGPLQPPPPGATPVPTSTDGPGSPRDQQQQQGGGSPSNFSKMAPVHPVWDILFNSLRGHFPDGGGSWAGKESGRFMGDFAAGSLWSILNQLP